MAAIGLAAAARLTGRNPSTIHRAMKTGRLSYAKDAAGERRVEVAELERVFGIKFPAGNGAMDAPDAFASERNDTHGPESERIIAAQRETIAQQDATIRHLRTLLEGEVDERRRMLALLTGPSRVRWWRRWFR